MRAPDAIRVVYVATIENPVELQSEEDCLCSRYLGFLG